MADDTQTTIGTPVPPVLVDGTTLYDSIMISIEPDLTTQNLELLEQKYPNETQEEKAKRAERYNVAFAEYEKRLAAYCEQWNNDLRRFKRQAIAYIEGDNRNSESTKLTDIESSLAA